MDRIPYVDTDSTLTVRVELQHAADVFLIDSINYQHYKSGRCFKYFGGHQTKSPVTISVQGAGRWYLIVNGNTRYNYQFF